MRPPVGAALALAAALIAFTLVTPATPVGADEPLGAPEADVLIIDNLLGLPYEPPEGAAALDPLQALKAYQALLPPLAEHAARGDERALRRLLLLTLHAQANGAAATGEFLAGRLVLVFEAQPDAFLTALGELPWLAAPACHYLARHFGFEDRHADDAEPFLQRYRGTIAARLPDAAAAPCLEALTAAAARAK